MISDSSTSPMTRPLLLACLSLICVMLTACSEPTQNTGTTGTTSGRLAMSEPDILSRRAYDTNNTRPQVIVNGTVSVQMNRGTAGQWTGTINVAANSTHTLQITWIETYKNTELPLAKATREVTVGGQAAEVTINPDWDTSMDYDGDGYSNLAERNAGSDPLDAASTPLTNGQTGVDVRISRIDPAGAPVIDGLGVAYASNDFRLSGEWSEATQRDVNDTDLLINNLMIDLGADQRNDEPSHHWAAMHDGTWLYIVVIVDDIGLNYADSLGVWHDDNLEIYIDGDNSKHASYGIDEDDRHIQLGLMLRPSNRPNNSSLPNPRIEPGVNSAELPDDSAIEFAVGLGTGPASLRGSANRQDVYEIRIDLAAYGIEIDSPFGFELQLDDDDDGVDRDAKWGWYHQAREDENIDQTWQNPALMGTAILEP